ncbi:MAG: recombination factor protein RarA, partial [Burkholderiaceae bacterium]|nr:recombination factor protein RarA [Burkholderiaceae bacterium]
LYKAYGSVRAFIEKDGSRPVPMRLRNAPTRLMKELGYGEGYRYAHDEPEGYAAGERYLPDGMAPVRWYEPTDHGVEQRIRERLQYLRGLDGRQRKGKAST